VEAAQKCIEEMSGMRLASNAPPLVIKFADTREQKEARFHHRQQRQPRPQTFPFGDGLSVPNPDGSPVYYYYPQGAFPFPPYAFQPGQYNPSPPVYGPFGLVMPPDGAEGSPGAASSQDEASDNGGEAAEGDDLSSSSPSTSSASSAAAPGSPLLPPPPTPLASAAAMTAGFGAIAVKTAN